MEDPVLHLTKDDATIVSDRRQLIRAGVRLEAATKAHVAAFRAYTELLQQFGYLLPTPEGTND